MQVVTIRTAQGTVWFPADLVPTRHHLGPAWGMAYDVEPLVVSQVKGKWLQQAAEENWCVILYHEPEAPVGHVARIDGRLQWQGAEGE